MFKYSSIGKTTNSFTNIEELHLVNQSFRDNNKVKEDVLTNFSDQLLVLSERIQQLERKQSSYSNVT